MDALQKIFEIINPAIDEMGFEIVRIRLQGQVRLTLQIMADRKDEYPISVDECAEISYVISALLDVEDPIEAAYQLEVGSPGLDRPLTRLKDYQKWQGFLCKLQLKWLLDGRRRFRGEILDITDQEIITIKDDVGKIFEIPFAQIEETRLILDDKLLAFSKAKAESLGLHNGVEGALMDDAAKNEN